MKAFSGRWYRSTAVVKGNKHGEMLHRVRAERALGKPLPPKAIVHHADGSMRDDAPLVICQDQAYHLLLHRRMRVKAAGGNPNTQSLCGVCKLPKDYDQFWRNGNRASLRSTCKSCSVQRHREWTKAQGAA